MHTERNKGRGYGTRLSFWFISLVHDNRPLPRIKDPYKALKAAGLCRGHQVLEVGCGPGFYTLPAAEIVGKEGRVFATDVNPWAIRRVKEKMDYKGIQNIRPMQVNAADCGLPDHSMDLAFLFGLPRVVGGMDDLFSELGRVLKPGGTVALQRSARSKEELVGKMKEQGFFFEGQEGRILKFKSKRQHHPDNFLEIHPQAAEGLGIKQGDWVKVSSPRGSIRTKAEVTLRIDPRVVHVFHGFNESNCKILTDHKSFDPLTGSTGLKSLMCRVEKSFEPKSE